MSIFTSIEDFDVTFYSFYQSSRRILQLLKWTCHTSFFLPMWSPTIAQSQSDTLPIVSSAGMCPLCLGNDLF